MLVVSENHVQSICDRSQFAVAGSQFRPGHEHGLARFLLQRRRCEKLGPDVYDLTSNVRRPFRVYTHPLAGTFVAPKLENLTDQAPNVCPRERNVSRLVFIDFCFSLQTRGLKALDQQ